MLAVGYDKIIFEVIELHSQAITPEDFEIIEAGTHSDVQPILDQAARKSILRSLISEFAKVDGRYSFVWQQSTPGGASGLFVGAEGDIKALNLLPDLCLAVERFLNRKRAQLVQAQAASARAVESIQGEKDNLAHQVAIAQSAVEEREKDLRNELMSAELASREIKLAEDLSPASMANLLTVEEETTSRSFGIIKRKQTTKKWIGNLGEVCLNQLRGLDLREIEQNQSFLALVTKVEERLSPAFQLLIGIDFPSPDLAASELSAETLAKLLLVQAAARNNLSELAATFDISEQTEAAQQLFQVVSDSINSRNVTSAQREVGHKLAQSNDDTLLARVARLEQLTNQQVEFEAKLTGARHQLETTRKAADLVGDNWQQKLLLTDVVSAGFRLELFNEIAAALFELTNRKIDEKDWSAERQEWPAEEKHKVLIDFITFTARGDLASVARTLFSFFIAVKCRDQLAKLNGNEMTRAVLARDFLDKTLPKLLFGAEPPNPEEFGAMNGFIQDAQKVQRTGHGSINFQDLLNLMR